MFGGKP
jgi:hypothetical protein